MIFPVPPQPSAPALSEIIAVAGISSSGSPASRRMPIRAHEELGGKLSIRSGRSANSQDISSLLRYHFHLQTIMHIGRQGVSLAVAQRPSPAKSALRHVWASGNSFQGSLQFDGMALHFETSVGVLVARGVAFNSARDRILPVEVVEVGTFLDTIRAKGCLCRRRQCGALRHRFSCPSAHSRVFCPRECRSDIFRAWHAVSPASPQV